jgi:L-fucose isomerase-like protein
VELRTVAQVDARDKKHMTTLGVIVGNRGFFPDHLCASGRKTILDVLERQGIASVIVPEAETNNGAVESLEEARRCADLFRRHRDRIDGVLVTLPNFGDSTCPSWYTPSPTTPAA